MTQEPENLPAFPQDLQGRRGDDPTLQGMTLRDYFMAHAPDVPKDFKRRTEYKEVQYPQRKGYVACEMKEVPEPIEQYITRWRCTYADAMLAARNKKNQ